MAMRPRGGGAANSRQATRFHEGYHGRPEYHQGSKKQKQNKATKGLKMVLQIRFGVKVHKCVVYFSSEKVVDGTNGDVAVDSYHLYKEDVKLLKNMGADAYKFSISWPRILPGGAISKGVNQDGINYYNNLINELVANESQVGSGIG